MSNKDYVAKMFEMQKKLKQAAEMSKEASEKITKEVEEVKIESVKEVEVESTLPTKYLSLNQLKLSAKEEADTTKYLDKMKQVNERYDTIQISEEKAIKIRKELVRLTTGVSAVVPLKCKGPTCSFSSTCLTGDTIVLGKKDKKIKDIIVNDIVYSFNLKTKLIEKDVVTEVKQIESKKVYLITTWYGTKIKATIDHRILTVNDKLNKFSWESIESGLSKNDKILISDVDDIDEDLESIGDVFVDKILSIKELGYETVYDITVKKNSNFFANNIVVHNCPYFTNGVAPIGEACPVEVQLLEYWLEKYKNEFNVDDNNLTDLHAIGRLCTLDIYEMRLTRYLAEHDQVLLVDFISSYDEQNNPISNKATSAAWDTIEKLGRERSKTLKELMATREAKAKLIKTVDEAHKSNSQSAMKKRYEEIIKNKIIIDGDAIEVTPS